MIGSTSKARRRHQYVHWSVLSCVAFYFLSLCTINPLLHAELVSQLEQTDHYTTVGHCTPPAAARQARDPLAAEHDRTAVPVCCELVRTHKTTKASSVLLVPPPLFGPALLPPDLGTGAWRKTGSHTIGTLHSSLSPPLYLLHATFLIWFPSSVLRRGPPRGDPRSLVFVPECSG